MNFISYGSGGLAYDLIGSGPDSVVLLHGCGVDHSSLSPQAEYLSKEFRVLSPDLRGHGGSRPFLGPYQMETFADDMAFLCRHLGLQRSILIGHSMGGNIALTLRSRHPDLVAALLLIDSALFIPRPQKEKLRSDFATALNDDDAVPFFKQALHSMCLEGEVRSAATIDSVSVAPDVLRLALKAHTIDFDSYSVFSGCDIPVGYIHSAMPFVDIGSLREACPHLLFGQTLGIGHFAPIESPEQVNGMIASFIKHVAS